MINKKNKTQLQERAISSLKIPMVQGFSLAASPSTWTGMVLVVVILAVLHWAIHCPWPPGDKHFFTGQHFYSLSFPPLRSSLTLLVRHTCSTVLFQVMTNWKLAINRKSISKTNPYFLTLYVRHTYSMISTPSEPQTRAIESEPGQL